MASTPAFTALGFNSNLFSNGSNYKPSGFLLPRCNRRSVIPARSEMKKKAIFKGTHMREQRLTELIEQKVMEAKQICGENEASDECKVAWDEVEEVSQAKANLRLKLHLLQQDPLQSFCEENPEADECRIYED